MSGGFVNGIEYPGRSFMAATAVASSGILVKIHTVANYVELCGAGERPDGYAHMSSMSLSTGVPVASVDAYVAIKGLVQGTVVEMVLPAVHSAITIGAEMETAATGCVIIKAGAGEIVGRALEAVAENTGGFVKVWVSQRTAAA